MTSARKAGTKRPAKKPSKAATTLGAKLGAKLADSLAKKRATPARQGDVDAEPAADASGDAADAAPPAENERLRFAQLMRGVKPLRDGTRRVPTSLEALDPPAGSTTSRGRSAEPASTTDRGARAKLEAFVAEGIRFEVVDDGESLEGRRLDVDPREIRKLRQLRYALDGTLDLHGLDAAEARTKLESFLRRRRLQGDRAVLVIHGRGKHSPRGYAVLRGEIAAWLSQGRAQRDVAAFASVHERDGGTGAVCVLLAR